jgi:SAM-dependent methyltransferase
MLKDILFVLKSQGISGIFSSVKRRILPPKAKCITLCREIISGKNGLEIGGPSSVFKRTGVLPIYQIINQLDNCNFSESTTWEGDISEGKNFKFSSDSPSGQQYVAEATDLSKLGLVSYDFILSSHMLEHTANPLKALSEWIRLLKDNGILILILPHKDGTFDHQRPVTKLEHLIEDFENGVLENDLTHLSEIIQLHDLRKDPGAGSFENFKERSENNFQNRCFHHHVFDTSLAVNMLHQQNLQILAVESILTCHIILISQKVPLSVKVNNEDFLKDSAKYRSLSPFISDKFGDSSN